MASEEDETSQSLFENIFRSEVLLAGKKEALIHSLEAEKTESSSSSSSSSSSGIGLLQRASILV